MVSLDNIMYDILVSCLYYYYIYYYLPPSFYHSLGRFLTTLGLHVQVGDPSYRVVR